MQDLAETADKEEMTAIASSLFSVIPGYEKAIRVPVFEAAQLKEEVFKRQFVARNTPCLIKGAVRHWPAFEKWRNPDYWVTTCGNAPTKVISHMNYYNSQRRWDGSETMPFHDAIRRLFANTDHILSMPSQPVLRSNHFFGITKDLSHFSFLQKKEKPLWDYPRALFIYRRAATAWHVHYCDETLMCQIKGAKEVLLLPSNMPKAGYVTEFLENEKYLKGEKLDPSLDLKPRAATVEEGDSLYIPPHWFHAVVPKDGHAGFTSLTVFRSPWHIYGNFFKFFVRRTYTTAWKTAKRQDQRRILQLCCYAFFSQLIRKLTGKR